MQRLIHYLTLLFCVAACHLLTTACGESRRKADNGAFGGAPVQSDATAYDLAQITESGELIAVTMSGPDTYFEYQGRAMGLQYALVERFARAEGLRLRVEVVRDTASLLETLKRGEADIAALPLPLGLIARNGLAAAGATGAKGKTPAAADGTSWAVRGDAKALAEALNAWYAKGVEPDVEKEERRRMSERTYVRRTVRAPYISREKGIISIYDAHFKRAAQTAGYDWRLIAAQCYQESGFDPNAVSWAGAKGLMQLMPATAEALGVSEAEVFNPAVNIAAAGRLLRQLDGQLSDVRNPAERLCFVLAAYNGGLGHIRDAQALARKYGKDAHKWEETAPFVLRLSEPRYYRDPVVRHGYMIGSETFGYVENVLARWQKYGGRPGVTMRRPVSSADSADNLAPGAPRGARHKRNRYSKAHKILTPEELKRAARPESTPQAD